MNDRVCCVTVTYGQRRELCQRTVRAAFAAGVDSAVVVDNASEPRFEYADADDARVHVHREATNGGSAGGFATGIALAFEQEDVEFAWLLDDDNQARTDSLSELLRWRRELAAVDSSVVAIAFRPQSSLQVRALAERRLARRAPARSSFLSFSVADVPRRLLALARRGQEPAQKPVRVLVGPYGGLLLSRAAYEQVGLPDRRLFTYADDTDYTYRLTAAGFSLYLVPDSIVDDIDPNWYADQERSGPFMRMLTASSDARVYYTVRNRLRFESKYWKRSDLMFAVNRCVFMTGLRLAATLSGHRERLRLIRRAIDDAAGDLLESPVTPP